MSCVYLVMRCYDSRSIVRQIEIRAGLACLEIYACVTSAAVKVLFRSSKARALISLIAAIASAL